MQTETVAVKNEISNLLSPAQETLSSNAGSSEPARIKDRNEKMESNQLYATLCFDLIHILIKFHEDYNDY